MFVESYYFIDKFGNELHFLPNENYTLPLSGVGNSGIQYQTFTGYLQDGKTIENFSLRERSISVRLIRANINTLTEYHEVRSKLLAFFNPLAAPLTLRVVRSDGSQRQLNNVYPTNGLTFTNPNITDFIIDETISLTAYDPLWYDPEAVSITYTPTQDTNLVFPITFPIVFGFDGTRFSTATQYSGQYKTYPIITINGAYSSAYLFNGYTGATLAFYIPIIDNEQRIINLKPDVLTINDAFGVSRVNELTFDSNLVDFYISPFMNASIDVILSNTSATSFVTVTYFNTYLGI